MTSGWGETEVLMDVSSRRLALEQHRHLAERGLLSFLSLLGAFLLNAIKRNQAHQPLFYCTEEMKSSFCDAGGSSRHETRPKRRRYLRRPTKV